jgi:hypothetical protein
MITARSKNNRIAIASQSHRNRFDTVSQSQSLHNCCSDVPQSDRDHIASQLYRIPIISHRNHIAIAIISQSQSYRNRCTIAAQIKHQSHAITSPLYRNHNAFTVQSTRNRFVTSERCERYKIVLTSASEIVPLAPTPCPPE